MIINKSDEMLNESVYKENITFLIKEDYINIILV